MPFPYPHLTDREIIAICSVMGLEDAPQLSPADMRVIIDILHANLPNKMPLLDALQFQAKAGGQTPLAITLFQLLMRRYKAATDDYVTKADTTAGASEADFNPQWRLFWEVLSRQLRQAGLKHADVETVMTTLNLASPPAVKAAAVEEGEAQSVLGTPTGGKLTVTADVADLSRPMRRVTPEEQHSRLLAFRIKRLADTLRAALIKASATKSLSRTARACLNHSTDLNNHPSHIKNFKALRNIIVLVCANLPAQVAESYRVLRQQIGERPQDRTERHLSDMLHKLLARLSALPDASPYRTTVDYIYGFGESADGTRPVVEERPLTRFKRLYRNQRRAASADGQRARADVRSRKFALYDHAVCAHPDVVELHGRLQTTVTGGRLDRFVAMLQDVASHAKATGGAGGTGDTEVPENFMSIAQDLHDDWSDTSSDGVLALLEWVKHRLDLASVPQGSDHTVRATHPISEWGGADHPMPAEPFMSDIVKASWLKPRALPMIVFVYQYLGRFTPQHMAQFLFQVYRAQRAIAQQSRVEQVSPPSRKSKDGIPDDEAELLMAMAAGLAPQTVRKAGGSPAEGEITADLFGELPKLPGFGTPPPKPGQQASPPRRQQAPKTQQLPQHEQDVLDAVTKLLGRKLDFSQVGSPAATGGGSARGKSTGISQDQFFTALYGDQAREQAGGQSPLTPQIMQDIMARIADEGKQASYIAELFQQRDAHPHAVALNFIFSQIQYGELTFMLEEGLLPIAFHDLLEHRTNPQSPLAGYFTSPTAQPAAAAAHEELLSVTEALKRSIQQAGQGVDKIPTLTGGPRLRYNRVGASQGNDPATSFTPIHPAGHGGSSPRLRAPATQAAVPTGDRLSDVLRYLRDEDFDMETYMTNLQWGDQLDHHKPVLRYLFKMVPDIAPITNLLKNQDDLRLAIEAVIAQAGDPNTDIGALAKSLLSGSAMRPL